MFKYIMMLYRAKVAPHDYAHSCLLEVHRLQALSILKLIASFPIAPPDEYILIRVAMLRDDEGCMSTPLKADGHDSLRARIHNIRAL